MQPQSTELSEEQQLTSLPGWELLCDVATFMLIVTELVEILRS